MRASAGQSCVESPGRKGVKVLQEAAWRNGEDAGFKKQQPLRHCLIKLAVLYSDVGFSSCMVL